MQPTCLFGHGPPNNEEVGHSVDSSQTRWRFIGQM